MWFKDYLCGIFRVLGEGCMRCMNIILRNDGLVSIYINLLKLFKFWYLDVDCK